MGLLFQDCYFFSEKMFTFVKVKNLMKLVSFSKFTLTLNMALKII